MSMFTINLAWPMCEKHALCVGSMPCVLETCSVCGKHAPCVRNMPHVWETCPEFGKQAPCVGNMTLCGKHALCVENMPHVWETCPMCGKHAPCVANMHSVWETWIECMLCPGCAKFQISALYDIRNPIKDTPVHHLQVGSLEDMAFLNPRFDQECHPQLIYQR